ncbi:uncharacterized protein LOC117175171 isoform X2 [Belonocnema kinseyi]|uniref:uncharacterized protein LOC117175171 isoform X2 n=1 Tax=Belonocnema kinseyi TaxID=2817044 RepID=UPI00143D46BC|nr:uncharacterized protein LOC117175171 isoform X2 [Belonocnema kinseyi]
MVDLSGPEGPIEHGFSNSVFIIPALIVIGLSVFFGYKLYTSLSERERKREEKRKLKQMKKKK